MTSLQGTLETLKLSGRKALVPYFVGGLSDDWLDGVRAAVHAGANAIEIGLPFSDPMIDGVVIQKAAAMALERGSTMSSILDELSCADVGVPLIAMTYFNVFHHRGLERTAAELARARVVGTIVPDLPLEEVGQWREVANQHDIASVLMVAPSTPHDRAVRLAHESQGFVYAAARMAVTGAASDEGDSVRVVNEVRGATATPVYVGIGITTAQQAAAAVEVADGVIVGTAIIQRLLDGEGASGVEIYVSELRRAID
jgi:tryptophan synthase alpha chain